MQRIQNFKLVFKNKNNLFSNITKSPITSIDLFELETLFLVKNIYSIRDIECHLNGIKETYNCELNISII